MKPIIHSQRILSLDVFRGLTIMLMIVVNVQSNKAYSLLGHPNWVAYFDQLLFSSKHLLDKLYDPEGFLTTIPAIATTLLGMLTASLLCTSSDDTKKFYMTMGFGLVLLCLSCLWNISFPINKKLWTSSYVLWSGGYALIGFSFCFFMIDVLAYKKWALPLKILGMNALFLFIFHVLIIKFQIWIHVPLRWDTSDNLQSVIRDYLFGGLTPQNADLVYAICFLAFNFLVALYLYQRKIFIRI